MCRLHRMLPLLVVIGVLLVVLPLGLATDSSAATTGPDSGSRETVNAGLSPAGLSPTGPSEVPIVAPSTLVLLGLGLVGLALCQAKLKQER